MIPDKIKLLLEKNHLDNGSICFLTGAGISAESGIPTFRGKEGYWTVGSEVYTPQEMATHGMFSRSPEAVWTWYLKRFLTCSKVEPNKGHEAIVSCEEKLGDAFTLVTQNIDSLHLRAGSSHERCFEIHGSAKYMRCDNGCFKQLLELPNISLENFEEDGFESIRHLLMCQNCGGLLRPHILWFDEYYTEEFYRAHSAEEKALASDVLIVAGTTLTTGLPYHIYNHFIDNHKAVIVIDTEAHDIFRYAEVYGGFIQGLSGEILPELAEYINGS